jgi:hypothetical protein
MAVNFRNNGIGTVTVRSTNRTSVASPNFAPKPNVSLSEINDVNTTGVQDGFTLVFNSDTGKYEASAAPPATVTEIKGGSF